MHEHLAKNKFAPHIWYCDTADVGLIVVVMDLAPGVSAYGLMSQEESESKTESAGKCPADAAPSLRSAVQCMHHGGFVFGDLRPPNIMVDGKKVMIIDFDWCGLENAVRYPVDISTTGNKGHSDVKPMGLIQQQHYLYMLE